MDVVEAKQDQEKQEKLEKKKSDHVNTEFAHFLQNSEEEDKEKKSANGASSQETFSEEKPSLKTISDEGADDKIPEGEKLASQQDYLKLQELLGGERYKNSTFSNAFKEINVKFGFDKKAGWSKQPGTWWQPEEKLDLGLQEKNSGEDKTPASKALQKAIE